MMKMKREPVFIGLNIPSSKRSRSYYHIRKICVIATYSQTRPRYAIAASISCTSAEEWYIGTREHRP